MSLDRVLVGVSTPVRRALESALAGHRLSVDEALPLDRATGADLHALCLVADALRAEQVGDTVTYVVNRNINFTNVCVKSCKFCAFSRDFRSEAGYFLDLDEVVRRAVEASEFGATEVCIQAGLPPHVDGRMYIDMVAAVHDAVPDLHIHALSPEEVKYGARLARMPYAEYLAELKAAGLGTLPGTSAEILDDAVRDLLAPTRIRTAEWVEIVTLAHEVGLRTSSTMMFGHLETGRQRLAHLTLLRDIQRQTGGFTEFVPLSFVHTEAPLYATGEVPGVRPGPTGLEVVRLYAIARLMLGFDIPNLQASWVKEGLRATQHLLSCGVNDVGGTLINESISTAAGSGHGQRVTPATLRALILGAGRRPAERSTTYAILRRHDGVEGDDRLDTPGVSDDTFGCYTGLTQDPRFDWKDARERLRRQAMGGEA